MRELVSRRQEEAQRTLLVKIHNYLYRISDEELKQVFSPIGNLESIEIFDHGSQFHSRVRFQERELAVKAIEVYNGRYLYDGGCCQMELSLEVPTSDPLSKIVAPVADSTQEVATNKVDQTLVVDEEPDLLVPSESQDGENEDSVIPLLYDFTKKDSTPSTPKGAELIKEPLKVVSNLDEDPKELQKINDGIVETEAMHHVMLFDPLPEGNTQNPELEIVVGNIRWKRVVERSEISMESLEFWNAYQVFVEMPKRKPEVNSMNECNSFEDMTIDAAPKGMGNLIRMSINWIEFDMDDLGTNSGAHKVFGKLSEHDVFRLESNLISRDVESSLVMELVVAKYRLWAENLVFDPGIVDRHEFIHGDFTLFVLVSIGNKTNVGLLLSQNHSNWVFDPGGACALLASGPKWMSNGVEAIRKVEVVDQGWQWGPGGLCVDLMRFCVLVCCNFVLGCGDFVLLMIL